MVNQLKRLYDEFYVSVCARCRGTGMLTCPHCHGTKTLRRKPGFLRTRDLAIVDNPKECYQCFYCGPPTTFDFDPMAPDDEPTALKIAENLKAAVANIWPRPFNLTIHAGTVACTECNGSAKVRRLTPDIAKAFGLEEPWDFQIAKRWGSRRLAVGSDAPKQRLFLEYPASEPRPIELPAPTPQKIGPGGSGEGSGFNVNQKGAFSLDDYVLNYASDDDENLNNES